MRTSKEEQLWDLVYEFDDLLISHLMGIAKPEEVRYRYAAIKDVRERTPSPFNRAHEGGSPSLQRPARFYISS